MQVVSQWKANFLTGVYEWVQHHSIPERMLSVWMIER
jgi:hypothetical protein